MARRTLKYKKIAQGATTYSMLLTPLATVLGTVAFAAIAMEGGNLRIELPNGLDGLRWPAFILAVAVVAFFCVHQAITTSKGESIEPEDTGPSADEIFSAAPTATVVEETRRSETITTRRDETVSLADRRLAEGGEPKPTDLSKRREGDPDPAPVADAGRLKAQDNSRDVRPPIGGDRRNDPPKPASPPAPAQPAAPTSVTATATVKVGEGDGAKKEPAKVT